MTDAPAWQILERLRDRLAAVSTAAGYFTDAGQHVDLERIDYDTAVDAFPRIALAEESTSPTAQNAGTVAHEMLVVVEGYQLADEAQAERSAARLKADLIRALAQTRCSHLQGIAGAQVTRFEITGESPTLRRPDGTAFIVVQARCRVAFMAYHPPAERGNTP